MLAPNGRHTGPFAIRRFPSKGPARCSFLDLCQFGLTHNLDEVCQRISHTATVNLPQGRGNILMSARVLDRRERAFIAEIDTVSK
jgi:hypothetical protein